jgi:predicted O-linked N-acetylglucosamine transferase (SPINDLY family)
LPGLPLRQCCRSCGGGRGAAVLAPPYLGRDDKRLQTVHGALAPAIIAAAYPRWAGPVHRPWHPGEPIRVGFLSGFFWRHSVWRLPTRGWIEHMDRDRFRLFDYHVRGEHNDQTVIAAQLFDRFERGQRTVAMG